MLNPALGEEGGGAGEFGVGTDEDEAIAGGEAGVAAGGDVELAAAGGDGDNGRAGGAAQVEFAKGLADSGALAREEEGFGVDGEDGAEGDGVLGRQGIEIEGLGEEVVRGVVFGAQALGVAGGKGEREEHERREEQQVGHKARTEDGRVDD